MEERYYWFAVIGEDSPLCGEEFLVSAPDKDAALEIARGYFPGEQLKCYGRVTDFEAEMMGLDCY